MKHFDAVIAGSGLGSLTAASLLCNEGLNVCIIEQNYLPGGCTSSYWRKGFVFESGATTLVGLDNGMPLKYVLDKTGIEINYRKLDLPMKVRLKNGVDITRHQDLNLWIEEAGNKFGDIENQRKFWFKCFEISQFVWRNSSKQLNFPPTKFRDFVETAKSISTEQLKFAKYAFITIDDMLDKYHLKNNPSFLEFIDEQLLITAQNRRQEVNALFGSAALCYTNFTNCYVDGGLINLVQPFIDYLTNNGGDLLLRNPIINVVKKNHYVITTKKEKLTADYFISGIPINNTINLYKGKYLKNVQKKLLPSEKLNSAFQMGIGFKSRKKFDTIHHQIHLNKPLSGTKSDSIFISINHEEDYTRCDEPGTRVASVSTHLNNPENNIFDKNLTEKEIIETLESHGILKQEDIIYQHSSAQKSWEKWTGRAYGFVGGYPQFKKIKPWQMIDSRLDGHKAYLCGDTAYPGQGIPGVTLSGIIAFHKLKQDWL